MSRRILLLNYEFPPVGGGGGVAAHVLAKGYIAEGYAVDCITTWYRGLPKYEVIDGISIYRVYVPGRTERASASMISLLLFPFAAFFRGAQLCIRHRYSFINTHFVVPTGPLGYVLSKLFGIRNVLTLHGGDVYDPTKSSSPHRHWYLRMLVRRLMNAAHTVVAQSNDIKSNAYTYYRPRKKIHMVPLAYEPFQFTPLTRRELGLDNDAFYTVSVGRLVKRKGFDFLIRTIASMRDHRIHALIAGDGPEREPLEALARALGISDRIHFLGFVSDERKFQYLNAADVYVLSSVHEGFGIVLQEARQVGLPIIATDQGGQNDIVDTAVPFGDVERLAESIRAVRERKERCTYPPIPGAKETATRYIALAGLARIGIEMKSLMDVSGIGTYCRNLLSAIAAIDNTSEYLVYTPRIPEESIAENVHFVRIRMPHKVVQPLWQHILVPFWAWYDGVSFVHYTRGVSPVMRLTRTITTIHDLIPVAHPEANPNHLTYLYWKFCLWFSIRTANALIVDSKATQDAVAFRYAHLKEKLTVIPLGVDVRSYEHADAHRGAHPLPERFLLFVGNVRDSKNLAVIVKSLERIPEDEGVHLVIAGEQQGKNTKLERALAASTLRDRVHFLGRVSDDELSGLYKKAVAFVFPSLYEGFGLPPLEAQAVGCPVIISNIPVLKETVGESALVCSPQDADCFAKETRRLLNDSALRARLIEDGQKNARERTWEKTAALTLRAYEAMLP